MPDQGTTTPGLLDPPFEEDAARLEDERPRNVDEELAAAVAEIEAARNWLRSAGEHLRQAAKGLPETALSETQAMQYAGMVHLVAKALAALHELDKVLGE